MRTTVKSGRQVMIRHAQHTLRQRERVGKNNNNVKDRIKESDNWAEAERGTDDHVVPEKRGSGPQERMSMMMTLRRGTGTSSE